MKSTLPLRAVSRRQRLRRGILFLLMLAFPLTFNYYSPVLPVMGTLAGVLPFSLLFWAAWLAGSLVLGRSACGWFCPLGGLQEIYDWAIQSPLRRIALLGWLKIGLCVAWLGVIIWALHRAGFWRHIDLLYMTERIVSWDRIEGNYIYSGMFGLVLIVVALTGRRGFCHYFCWYASLNIAGTWIARRGKLPRLQLAGSAGSCSGCGRCSAVCPMSLPVAGMVRKGDFYQQECILCGCCVDSCPAGCIRFALNSHPPETASH